jgi:hypothetical protein
MALTLGIEPLPERAISPQKTLSVLHAVHALIATFYAWAHHPY